MKLNHAGIQVKDIKKSRKLFSRLLGLKPAWATDADWTLLSDPRGGMLALIKKGHRRHHPHIGFMVPSRNNVDRYYQKARQLKLKASAPEHHRDGTYGFYFKDYDGNNIEILWAPKNRG